MDMGIKADYDDIEEEESSSSDTSSDSGKYVNVEEESPMFPSHTDHSYSLQNE